MRNLILKFLNFLLSLNQEKLYAIECLERPQTIFEKEEYALQYKIETMLLTLIIIFER